jgi:ankyrin repeat protein
MFVTTIAGFLLFTISAVFGIGFLIAGFIFRKLKRSYLKVLGTIFLVLGSLLVMPAVSCTALSAATWIRYQSEETENKGPLLCAIEENDLDAVESIVSEGADVNAEVKSYQDITPLVYAARLGRLEITGFLIRRKADVNKPCGLNDDQFPLLEAIRHDDKPIEGDNIATIEELLKHGAEAGIKDGNENALHHAVRYNDNPEVIQLLLKHGVDINEQSAAGFTPLMITAFLNGQTTYKIPFAKLLIAYGAKVNIQDEQGKTVLDHSRESAFDEMTAILIAFSAKTGKELRETHNI